MNQPRPTQQNSPQSDAPRSGTGFWRVVQSTLAAGIGVQSKANKERDFQRGNPLHFVIGGLVGTLLFCVCVWLLVKYLILSSQ